MAANDEDDDGSLDFLAQLVAQRIAQNPELEPKFVPGHGTIAPGGEVMELLAMQDDLSVLTPDTYWQGRNSVATMGTWQTSRATGLTAISETSSSGVSSGRTARRGGASRPTS